METQHRPVIADARYMEELADQSIDLVVTSPPYPMIQMWDDVFAGMSGQTRQSLKKGDGPGAFEAMHQAMDPVWEECFRVLKDGGFACINIGDATRTLKERFALYPNHARILTKALDLGFTALPCILWRKQTNAPNKYMGSGMLPAGAYVTLEHEYILVLRKGGKRRITQPAERELRQESAIFWEERNDWFSDIWLDLKGSRQALTDKAARKRSGAFPFELAFRLINMYSLKGDHVLDPFLGTGTTMAAAMVAGRHSTGFELDPALAPVMAAGFKDIVGIGQQIIHQRLIRHINFVADRMAQKGPLKHQNRHYGFPVMTAQEKELLFNTPAALSQGQNPPYTLAYDPAPQKAFIRDWSGLLETPGNTDRFLAAMDEAIGDRFTQKELF